MLIKYDFREKKKAKWYHWAIVIVLGMAVGIELIVKFLEFIAK